MKRLSSEVVKELNISEQFIEPSKINRPQTMLKSIDTIVVHFFGLAGCSAQSSRDYMNNLSNGMFGNYEELKAKNIPTVSSHFVIGLEGEIIACVPTNEIAYCSNKANSHCISIEFAHPDVTGKPNKSTYTSLVKLVAYLCKEYNIDVEKVIRHYDVTGKICPAYYVRNTNEWSQFKNDVACELKSLNGEDEPFYRVQVGAFKSRALAENMREELKRKGYSAFIVNV